MISFLFLSLYLLLLLLQPGAGGQEYEGRVTVGKVNVDDEQELAIRYGVMSIPTVIFFKDGQEIDRKVGVMPPQVFTQVLDENA